MAEGETLKVMAITKDESHCSSFPPSGIVNAVNNVSDSEGYHINDLDHRIDGDTPLGATVNNSNNGGGQKRRTSSFQITGVIKRTDNVPASRLSEVEGDDDLDDTNTEEVSRSSEPFESSKLHESGESVLDTGTASTPSIVSADDVPYFSDTDALSSTIYHIPRRDGNMQAFDGSLMSLLQPISETQAKIVTQQPLVQNQTDDLKYESRFKVVKIESELPFKRGRWACLDYRSERSELSDENAPHSGNSSNASSVHYVHEVDDPSRNPIGESQYQNGDHATLPPTSNGKHIIQASQQPLQTSIQPSVSTAPDTGQPVQLTPMDTMSQMTQLISGRVIMDESSSTIETQLPQDIPAFHTTQSFMPPGQMPNSNHHTQTMFASNIPLENEDFTNVPTDYAVSSAKRESLDISSTVDASHQSALVQQSLPMEVAAHVEFDLSSSDSNCVTSNQPPISQHQTIAGEVTVHPQVDQVQYVSAPDKVNQPLTNNEQVSHTSNEAGHVMIKTTTPALQLFTMVGRPVEESGASTVAIDNKIEQAMDLVKSHLMYAVREEVDVLREQIKDLLEKNSRLEMENKILRQSASPETLALLKAHQQPASVPNNTVHNQPPLQQHPPATS